MYGSEYAVAWPAPSKTLYCPTWTYANGVRRRTHLPRLSHQFVQMHNLCRSRDDMALNRTQSTYSNLMQIPFTNVDAWPGCAALPER